MSEKKTKTTLIDLNEYLFEALDVISNPDLELEELKDEISRVKTIAYVAEKIIDNTDMMLRVFKAKENYGSLPKIFGDLSNAEE